MTLGLLHPGEMGSSVGASLRKAGARVVWTSEGRGPETRARAERAGLEDVGLLAALADVAEVIISVCPPHASRGVAEAVVDSGFRGHYVDANAISPVNARAIGDFLAASGIEFVDGGIIGPPALKPGTTRLYLSGPEADACVALFEGGPLEAIAIEGGAGAASALKMVFAAWTKGTSALLLAIRALAVREGVEVDLLAEWERGLRDLPGRSEFTARGTAPKAWRFVGEMEQIAATFSDAGLPDGFHRAAGEIYERMADFKDSAEPPDLPDVVRKLLGEGD